MYKKIAKSVTHKLKKNASKPKATLVYSYNLSFSMKHQNSTILYVIRTSLFFPPYKIIT